MIQVKVLLPSQRSPGMDTACLLYRQEKDPKGSTSLPKLSQNELDSARHNGFKGQKNRFFVLPSLTAKQGQKILLGLGSKKEADLNALREAMATLSRFAHSRDIRSVAVQLPPLGQPLERAQAAVEGIHLGGYRFSRKTNQKTKASFSTLYLIVNDPDERQSYVRGVERGHVFSDAVKFVRDLVNTPPSDMTPLDLVRIAKSLAKGSLKLRVYQKNQLAKMGMGALLGVNRGSALPPFFIHMIYKPSHNKSRKIIGLCGKGITFDSGGLSLKPAKSMETMKMDMAGAATVLGIFKAVLKLKPPIEIHGFAPLTENMPGMNALKPGDILKTYGGKTIEVLNTDAEGRLILADALGFASKQNLDCLIDLATLTGAVSVALGNSITGVMATNAKILERLKKASELSGEKMWELPLEKEYESHFKSQVADVKNIGLSGQAGTIIGGLFLKEFVKKDLPWAHLDIAGTAWADSDTPLARAGATGAMVRTLLNLILNFN